MVVTCLIGLFALGTTATSSASANPCEPEHCYALAGWSIPSSGIIGGIDLNIETSYATVPYPERMQNEAWVNFYHHNWVEAGDTTGYIGSPSGPSGERYSGEPVYFTADGLPSGGWYELDEPNGPGGNNWFPVDIHYVPSAGEWYMAIGSVIGTWGEKPSSAERVEAGLEETNTDIANWGNLEHLSWWSAQNGAKYEGWTWDGYNAKPEEVPKSPNQVTCADMHGGVTSLYFVANGNSC
jgi:hypothetical protein